MACPAADFHGASPTNGSRKNLTLSPAYSVCYPELMKLSAKKRLELIDRELHDKGEVFSRNLAVRCETSMETIRKDLEMLEAQGVAVKVYGGAMLAQPGAERILSMRM